MKKIILIALYLFSTQVNAQDSSQTVTAKNDTAIFTKVEIDAVYPGGDGAWQHYLLRHMHYPDRCSIEKYPGNSDRSIYC